MGKVTGNLVHVCINKARNIYADIELRSVKLHDNYTLEDFFNDHKALCEKVENLTNKYNDLVSKHNALKQAYTTNKTLVELKLENNK